MIDPIYARAWAETQGETIHTDDDMPAPMSRDEALAEVARLKGELAKRPRQRHFEILCEAMAEVKAASDGLSDQPIADIVAGCIAEIEALPADAFISQIKENSDAE